METWKKNAVISKFFKREADTYWGVEHVDGLDCLLSLLLESKHQIDPAMEVLGDVGRFQGLSENHHKQPGVVVGPGGQGHIADNLPILSLPKVKTYRVLSQFEKLVEFKVA